MSFAAKLKALRVSYGWSQEEMAEKLGTSKQVISRYEKAQRVPKIDIVRAYAEKLGISIASLLSEDMDIMPVRSDDRPVRTVPLVGTIACGVPIFADENVEDYIALPDGVQADFCLRCRGDSMIGARICDGDIVFIRQQPDVQDGEIAAVLIGEEATLKRVYKIGRNRLELRAENPMFPVMRFEGETLSEISILGKAVSALTSIH